MTRETVRRWLTTTMCGNRCLHWLARGSASLASSRRGDVSSVGVVVLTLFVHAGVAWAQPISTELAGTPLPRLPWVDVARVFQAGSAVSVAIDPHRFPGLIGKDVTVYVVANRTAQGWVDNPTLVDARGAAQSLSLLGATIEDNTFRLSGTLNADAGTAIGVGYDLVVDVDNDGQLSSGDLIDGLSDGAGFLMIKDLTTAGPIPTQAITYTASNTTPGFSQARLVYPANLVTSGPRPLVIISHGNGHQYTWYDYLQQHLASHGYITVSHQNDTVPGPESAATTTLQHLRAVLAQQSTIASGALNDRIDTSKIILIGHSRGGEGVVRAYDRAVENDPIASNFTASQIVLVCPIAPITFLSPAQTDPHGVNLHLLYGSADGDVSGAPDLDGVQPFQIYERATGQRQSTYIQGADHNDFNSQGFNDFTGPANTQIGRVEAQRVTRAVYLALLRYYIDGDTAGEDFLWRPYQAVRPASVAATTIWTNMFNVNTTRPRVVIDDFQTQTATNLSSSGGSVNVEVADIVEGRLDDNNTTFSWSTSDRFNGFTYASGSDTTRGMVFRTGSDVTGNRLTWSVPTNLQDVSALTFLSFRACQGTRHPNTRAELAPQSWFVELIDTQGRSSVVQFSANGQGITEPYQRTGSGSGPGWQNEVTTVRIRLSDFLANGAAVDLTKVAAIRMHFRTDTAPLTAYLGFDDLEFVAE